MEIELKSWENVNEFITLMNERFVDLYNSKIVCSDVNQEDESILESYQIYMANAIQKLVPSLVVVMFQNGSYGYYTTNGVLDFYGRPVSDQKYIMIFDMEFDLLKDGVLLLETVKHRSFERKRVLI